MTPPAPIITYIFRKRIPTNFSIEQLFDALIAQIEKSGATIRRVELPLVSKGMGSVLRNIWFVARQPKAAVLHITGDVHYATILRPFSKTIITIHDCVALQRGTGIKRLIMWILWFWLPIRLASLVIVISEQTKSELRMNVAVPDSKLAVIPNFVDSAFAFSERSFSSHQPRILHVGTTNNKNLTNVAAALHGMPCVLVIVGQLSRAQIADLEAHAVTYENHVGVDVNAMLRLYRDADIISFPSTYEGFGMPILEGQAVGRPVLTSDLEPMRSVAGQGGALLVNPHSIEAIRDGFRALMRDAELRARLISAGRKNASRYTLDEVASSYLALYRRLRL